MQPAQHKACFKCKRVLPLKEFYVHPQMGDGRLNKCKECARRDVSENYRRNIEHYDTYERRRARTPERRKARAESLRRRDPVKREATYLTTNAIRDG